MTRHHSSLPVAPLLSGFAFAFLGMLGAGMVDPALSQVQSRSLAKASDLQGKIEAFSFYLIWHWQQDPKLSSSQPPQIITSISANSKVIGGCFSLDSQTGRLTRDVGGTSYCAPTNTIFVVEDQLGPLQADYGDAAVGYVLAHEYGHYLQNRFKIEGDTLHLELQADCLAGSILGQGYKELDLTQQDILAMASTAYSLADEDHGTSGQRAYAVFTGLGQSKELTCALGDMVKLSKNQVADPLFKQLNGSRSAGGTAVKFDERGPNLKTISGSLGI